MRTFDTMSQKSVDSKSEYDNLLAQHGDSFTIRDVSPSQRGGDDPESKASELNQSVVTSNWDEFRLEEESQAQSAVFAQNISTISAHSAGFWSNADDARGSILVDAGAVNDDAQMDNQNNNNNDDQSDGSQSQFAVNWDDNCYVTIAAIQIIALYELLPLQVLLQLAFGVFVGMRESIIKFTPNVSTALIHDIAITRYVIGLFQQLHVTNQWIKDRAQLNIVRNFSSTAIRAFAAIVLMMQVYGVRATYRLVPKPNILLDMAISFLRYNKIECAIATDVTLIEAADATIKQLNLAPIDPSTNPPRYVSMADAVNCWHMSDDLLASISKRSVRFHESISEKGGAVINMFKMDKVCIGKNWLTFAKLDYPLFKTIHMTNMLEWHLVLYPAYMTFAPNNVLQRLYRLKTKTDENDDNTQDSKATNQDRKQKSNTIQQHIVTGLKSDSKQQLSGPPSNGTSNQNVQQVSSQSKGQQNQQRQQQSIVNKQVTFDDQKLQAGTQPDIAYVEQLLIMPKVSTRKCAQVMIAHLERLIRGIQHTRLVLARDNLHTITPVERGQYTGFIRQLILHGIQTVAYINECNMSGDQWNKAIESQLRLAINIGISKEDLENNIADVTNSQTPRINIRGIRLPETNVQQDIETRAKLNVHIATAPQTTIPTQDTSAANKENQHGAANNTNLQGISGVAPQGVKPGNHMVDKVVLNPLTPAYNPYPPANVILQNTIPMQQSHIVSQQQSIHTGFIPHQPSNGQQQPSAQQQQSQQQSQQQPQQQSQSQYQNHTQQKQQPVPPTPPVSPVKSMNFNDEIFFATDVDIFGNDGNLLDIYVCTVGVVHNVESELWDFDKKRDRYKAGSDGKQRKDCEDSIHNDIKKYYFDGEVRNSDNAQQMHRLFMNFMFGIVRILKHRCNNKPIPESELLRWIRMQVTKTANTYLSTLETLGTGPQTITQLFQILMNMFFRSVDFTALKMDVLSISWTLTELKFHGIILIGQWESNIDTFNKLVRATNVPNK